MFACLVFSKLQILITIIIIAPVTFNFKHSHYHKNISCPSFHHCAWKLTSVYLKRLFPRISFTKAASGIPIATTTKLNKTVLYIGTQKCEGKKNTLLWAFFTFIALCVRCSRTRRVTNWGAHFYYSAHRINGTLVLYLVGAQIIM
jgi:hypothetical protein